MDVFETPPPVDYLPPAASIEHVLVALDQIGTILSQQLVLSYRTYDLLVLIAAKLDRPNTDKILLAHENGQIISGPAWFNEEEQES